MSSFDNVVAVAVTTATSTDISPQTDSQPFSHALLSSFAHESETLSDSKKVVTMLNKYSKLQTALDETIAKAQLKAKPTIAIAKKKWPFVKRTTFIPEDVAKVQDATKELSELMTTCREQYGEFISQCNICCAFFATCAQKQHDRSIDHVIKERDFFKNKVAELERDLQKVSVKA